MSKIKNKEQYYNLIMDQNRHQFIYGYNNQDRSDFLKELSLKYPITLDESRPMGIYLENIGLPKRIKSNDGLDEIILAIINREYCYFSIALEIVNTTLEQIDKHNIKKRMEELLNNINRLFTNKSHVLIGDLQELSNILNKAKEVYYIIYTQYIKTGKLINFASNLPVTFISLEEFINYYKEMLNNNSYFGIIIDHQKTIDIKSQQAINNLIGSRINRNLSMKIVCEPDNWEIYCDLNGVFIENVHDYGIIEIDNCYKEYMKKLKREYKK